MASLTEQPFVPLEVAENIIDQLGSYRDVPSLRNCALTCRGWRPRARYHLMMSICIQSREDLSSISDYLDSDPRMAASVRSLSTLPAHDIEPYPRFLLETIPTLLLPRLTNLQEYSIGQQIEYREYHRYVSISVNETMLRCIRTYLHVEELRLGPLKFRTIAELAQLLIALPRMRRLKCTDLRFMDEGDHWSSLTGTSRFRDKCSLLSEVTVTGREVSPAISLVTEMSVSSLETLRCNSWSIRLRDHVHSGVNLSELKRLRFLEVMLDAAGTTLDRVTPLLSASSHPCSLRELMLTFTDISELKLWGRLLRKDMERLEETILPFGKPCVIVSIPSVTRNRQGYWSKLIRSYLPRLHESGLLRLEYHSRDGYEQANFGHDEFVEAMAVSPDGQYVATAARDDTVIIWRLGTSDTQTALIEMQPDDSTQDPGIHYLLFSDTSDFLMAGHRDSIVYIWHVPDGSLVDSFKLPRSLRVLVGVWWKDSLDCLTLTMVLRDPYDDGRGVPFLWVIKAQRQADQPLSFSPPDDATPTHIQVEEDFHLLPLPRLRRLYVVAQSSSGRLVAVQMNSELSIWQIVGPGSAYGPQQLTTGIDWRDHHKAAFVGDEHFVSLCNGTIRWWDTSSFPLTITEPQGMHTFEFLYPGPWWSMKPTYSLTMSPTACFFISLNNDHRSVPVLVHTSCFRARRPPSDAVTTTYTFLHGHTCAVTAVCVSPCERYVATASKDTTVRLWNSGNGSLIWTFGDHDTAVNHIAFSPDGRFLASADESGKVCIHILSRFIRDVPPAPILAAT